MFRPYADSAGMFSRRYFGNPPPTFFETKFMTTPWPWVNCRYWLTQVCAFAGSSGESSRVASINRIRVWCHCESCRKHSGAPVSVFVAFKRDAYVVTEGQITKFSSSPGRWRGFCARCGSTLTCEGDSLSTETHFHVGAFRDAARFRPTRHIFPEERL